MQAMHKRVRDAFDDAPHASPAYVSTELRLPEQEDLCNDPEACFRLIEWFTGRFNYLICSLHLPLPIVKFRSVGGLF
jgi:hypothetical protein